MAKKYLEINNYSNTGSLYVSSKVFKDIAFRELIKSKSIYLEDESNLDELNKDITCSIKDNKGNLNINIWLKKGYDANTECIKIQKDIYNEILLLLEQVPVKIKINVEKII